MKSLPWKQLLQQHPIFSTVRDEGRIDALLADDVSWERVYAKDEVIVSQDEVGNSLFVIGSGSAEAVFEVGEGPPILLTTMKKGEVFGEMAFFEQRSRAATVRAKEACTVLEIRGPEFQKLVDEYPDIEFRLLLKMSERLRHTNERVLTLHLKTVDEKLKLFNDRLETDQKVVEASLKAAQSVFDQTKIRTDEVIQSADRSRSRLNTSMTVVGGFVTVLVALLGLFGWKQVSDIASHAERAGKLLEEVKKSAGTVETLKSDAEKLNRDAKGFLDGLRESVTAAHRRQFYDAVDKGSAVDAITAYRQLRLDGELDKELGSMLAWIERQVVAEAQPPPQGSDPVSIAKDSNVKNFINLFQMAVVDAQKPRDKLDAYYLLLVYADLTGQDKFEQQEEGPYRGFATRQEALAALQEYSKSIPKETRPRAVSADLVKHLAERLPGKANEDALRNLSRLAFVSVGSD